jgi:hypothetical protein
MESYQDKWDKSLTHVKCDRCKQFAITIDTRDLITLRRNRINMCYMCIKESEVKNEENEAEKEKD